jgi:hypothetical protein
MDGLPRLVLRSGLLDVGVVDSEIRRDCRAGRLVRLRRGAYLPGDETVRSSEARHALLVAAEAARVDPSSVVSHVSAAVLHGLPVWDVPLGRVQVTRARSTGARNGPSVRVHSAPLDPAEVVQLGGVRSTSAARTVVDLARRSSFESAVVTADAALRTGLVTRESLDRALLRATGWKGVPAARRAIAFADGRSASVGESRSRVAIWRAGLPPPTLQWEVRHRGALLGRTDFAWEERRLVAEFDGQVKYGRLLLPGQDAGDVVFDEKLREDSIRAAGLTVKRWTWRDLTDFKPTAARIREALAPG